jgi:DUF1680 family protein
VPDYYQKDKSRLREQWIFSIFAENYDTMKINLKNLICLLMMGFVTTATAQNVKVQDVITPLPDGSIHLTNYFENDILNSVEHWNKGVVPYRKLMDFYVTGGSNFALGEMWAKAVRSGSMLYGYTGDQELKKILDNTVSEVFTTVRSNGAISTVPIDKQPNGKCGDMWERKYVMLGLSQYYAHVKKDPKVYQLMINEANSVLDQIGDAPKTPMTTQGWSKNGIESFTVMEPIMRIYKLTGDKKYLDFCTYLIKEGGCKGADLFQEACDNVLPRQMGNGYPKAYEMLSLFEGAVEYYRCTGDERIKKAFMNLFENIKKYEITLIGNGGADQPYYPKWNGEAWDNTALEQSNPNIKRMMETCAGVTWMKLCSQILRITGDPSTVDYIEKYAYNGLLGAMKPGGDGFSYVNLLNGRKVTDIGWGTKVDGMTVTCCNLSGPMGLAYIPYVAVMQSKSGPVINLYNAANVTAKTKKGRDVKFTIDSDFPYNNKVVIEINDVKSEKFDFKLHIPAWSKATAVRVNGKAFNYEYNGKYLSINRKWNNGDKIELTFDMRAKLIDAPHGSNPEAWNYQALQYGPIVLSRDENIDPDYNKPVQIVADANGEVKITPVKPQMSTTRMEFLVPTTTGTIHMVDYSSVNGWNGKKICTWMPKLK